MRSSSAHASTKERQPEVDQTGGELPLQLPMLGLMSPSLLVGEEEE